MPKKYSYLIYTIWQEGVVSQTRSTPASFPPVTVPIILGELSFFFKGVFVIGGRGA